MIFLPRQGGGGIIKGEAMSDKCDIGKLNLLRLTESVSSSG